jgi:hypothetical protein
MECELHRPLRVCDGGIQISKITITFVPHVRTVREVFKRSYVAMTGENYSALNMCDGVIQITTPPSVVVACLK